MWKEGFMLFGGVLGYSISCSAVSWLIELLLRFLEGLFVGDSLIIRGDGFGQVG